MLLFYVRHGEPIYDPDSLTELGAKQAEALSERFKIFGLDRIYSSTSNRAMQTAKPTSEKLGLSIIPLPWCHEGLAAREFNAYGEEGKWGWCFQHDTTVKLFRSKEIKELGDKWYDHPAFSKHLFKEGVLRVNKETDAFLELLGFSHDRENRFYRKNGKKIPERVALFAHQGFSMVFLSSLMDIPYPEYCTRHEIGHSSMTVIDFHEWGDVVIPRFLQYSNDSHIYKAGLPLSYNNEYEF